MKARRVLGLAIVVVLGAAVGIAAVGFLGGMLYLKPVDARRSSAQDPAELVADFYAWYAETADLGGATRNLLADGAHRTCGYLTPRFIEEIDEVVASFDKGGFDPILLAQDVPERFEVGTVEVSGDEAQVEVQMYWAGNPTPTLRTVLIEKVDGEWLIDGVRM